MGRSTDTRLRRWRLGTACSAWQGGAGRGKNGSGRNGSWRVAPGRTDGQRVNGCRGQLRVTAARPPQGASASGCVWYGSAAVGLEHGEGAGGQSPRRATGARRRSRPKSCAAQLSLPREWPDGATLAPAWPSAPTVAVGCRRRRLLTVSARATSWTWCPAGPALSLHTTLWATSDFSRNERTAASRASVPQSAAPWLPTPAGLIPLLVLQTHAANTGLHSPRLCCPSHSFALLRLPGGGPFGHLDLYTPPRAHALDIREDRCSSVALSDRSRATQSSQMQ